MALPASAPPNSSSSQQSIEKQMRGEVGGTRRNPFAQNREILPRTMSSAAFKSVCYRTPKIYERSAFKKGFY